MSILPRKITVAGVRLNYLDIAPGDLSSESSKPPLLLLHGLLATAQTLAELIGHLPKDRRIVALDILSAQTEDGALEGDTLDVRAETLAKLVSGFAKNVDLQSPIVIGHSHGGALALWMATVAANDIQGLVLLCPAHPFEGYRSHVVAFYLTRWGRFLALSIPLAPSRMILRAYNEAAGPGRPITMTHLKPYLPVLRSRNTLRRVLQMLHTWEGDMSGLREAMLASPVTQPTLLIWGDRDTVVPLSSAAALQEHLDASELEILHGRGHLLAEEAPEQCGSLIRAWLARLDAGRTVRPPPSSQAGESSPNSSDTQERIAAPRTASFDPGD